MRGANTEIKGKRMAKIPEKQKKLERHKNQEKIMKYPEKIMYFVLAIAWVYIHFFMFRPFNVHYQVPKVFSTQQHDTIIMTYNGHSTDIPQPPNPSPRKSNVTYTSAFAKFRINGQEWQCGCWLASNGKDCILMTKDKRTLWRGTQFDELHMIDIGNRKCFITKLVWQKETFILPSSIQNKLQYYIHNICKCGEKKMWMLSINVSIVITLIFSILFREK